MEGPSSRVRRRADTEFFGTVHLAGAIEFVEAPVVLGCNQFVWETHQQPFQRLKLATDHRIIPIIVRSFGGVEDQALHPLPKAVLDRRLNDFVPARRREHHPDLVYLVRIEHQAPWGWPVRPPICPVGWLFMSAASTSGFSCSKPC